MSDARELESRIERLESALQAIDARLAKLEGRPVGEGPLIPPTARPPSVAEGSVLGLLGVSILILGGAFVLRALTESAVLPRPGGAIFGLAYAGLWIWNADRVAARQRRRAAQFQAVTAAVIAFPLVWETTVRFSIIPPVAASIAVGILGLLFLWVAVRSQQQVVAWVGSVAAIVAAFAIGPSPAMLIALSAIGVATTIAARRWEFAAWPAALATTIIALITIFTRPAGAVAALVCFSALWATAIAVLRSSSDIFVIVQATVAVLFGVGGTTFLLMPSAASLSLIWSAFGLATAALGRRVGARALAVQSVFWIVAAAFAGGLLLAMVSAFGGQSGPVDLPPEALASGAAALIAFGLLHGEPERVVLLSLVLSVAFGASVALGVSTAINGALLRTAVLALFASALAIVGRLMQNRVASILARAVLIVGGLKLLVEDLRVGSAAILVISFACYGAALLIVARSGWAAMPAANRPEPSPRSVT